MARSQPVSTLGLDPTCDCGELAGKQVRRASARAGVAQATVDASHRDSRAVYFTRFGVPKCTSVFETARFVAATPAGKRTFSSLKNARGVVRPRERLKEGVLDKRTQLPLLPSLLLKGEERDQDERERERERERENFNVSSG